MNNRQAVALDFEVIEILRKKYPKYSLRNAIRVLVGLGKARQLKAGGRPNKAAHYVEQQDGCLLADLFHGYHKSCQECPFSDCWWQSDWQRRIIKMHKEGMCDKEIVRKLAGDEYADKMSRIGTNEPQYG